MSDRIAINPPSQIAELKVSGHTMALEPGMYCVFSAPGSVAPAPDTGLPTVRISAAPGHVPGQVEVVGLHSNGWIGPDSATLVRIANARSNVLVTVYQARDTRAEAPQIQVVRISADAVSPAQPGIPAAIARNPNQNPTPSDLPTSGAPVSGQQHSPQDIHVVAHIYGRGDVGGQLGAWVGEPGSKRWIEGFAVAPIGNVPPSDIEYQAVLGRGWLSPWSEGGQFCGSRSMALPILGMRVRLRGASAGTHRIILSATFVDGSKVGPVTDAEPCEAPSLAALESFHLAIEPVTAGASAGPATSQKLAEKASTKPAATTKRAVKAPPPPEPAKPAAAAEAAKAVKTKTRMPAAGLTRPTIKPAAAARPAAKTTPKPTPKAAPKAISQSLPQPGPKPRATRSTPTPARRR